MGTDQDKLEKQDFGPLWPIISCPSPTAVALQKEDALSIFLEQMSLSQKTLLPRTLALGNRNNNKCKPVDITRRSGEATPNLI